MKSLCSKFALISYNYYVILLFFHIINLAFFALYLVRSPIYLSNHMSMTWIINDLNTSFSSIVSLWAKVNITHIQIDTELETST
jgi:hypothetical protein